MMALKHENVFIIILDKWRATVELLAWCKKEGQDQLA